MHYLSNLNFIIQADVYKMKIEKFFQWGRIVDTMRLWAERDNTEIIGVSHLQSQDDAWKQKKGAMLAILDALASLLKEEDKNGFHCLYWALKTYGMVCMDFKDLEEAKQVFRRLKHECQEKQMFHHKMVTYKQLGYINRLLKQHTKATGCFKKYL